MVHNYLPVACRNTLTATKSTSRTVFLYMIYGIYDILIFRISVSECGYQRDALSSFILALENNCMWGISSKFSKKNNIQIDSTGTHNVVCRHALESNYRIKQAVKPLGPIKSVDIPFWAHEGS